MDVIAEGTLELLARLVAEQKHAIPAGVPGNAAGHRLVIGGLEVAPARIAPAPIRRTKTLVEHVDVEPGNAVGQHLGGQAFHDLKVSRVVTISPQRFSVLPPHGQLGMLIEEGPPLLDDAVGDDGHTAPAASSTVSRSTSRDPSPGHLGTIFES